ncbi:MAG: glycosyltransferase family 4 protein [Methanobacterium sp.]|nr:glycosyltransferase family 4 protein [Methanobacterium sp.]
MRILIVAHGHPDFSSGGAEIAAYALFQALKMAGYAGVSFLAPAHGSASVFPGTIITPYREDEYLLHGGEFDRFLFTHRTDDVRDSFLSILNNIKPDIVHFHHYIDIGLELIAATRKFRKEIKIVVTLHEFAAICHHYGLMVKTGTFGLCSHPDDTDCAQCFEAISAKRFFDRRRHILEHFGQVNAFIAPSSFLRDRYIDWGLYPNRIHVIENTVFSPPSPPPAGPTQPSTFNVFGFFGQMHPFKGLDCLLAAFDHFRSFPSAGRASPRLIIHGAGLETNDELFRNRIAQSLARHGARVTFAGSYRQEELPQRMAGVDWVVVPSIWWENAPLVIEEALLHRRPVLCGDIGGMREKVRAGLDGFHFRTGDSSALAAIMMQLAGNGTVWHRLQATLRMPPAVTDWAARHIDLYRDQTLG